MSHPLTKLAKFVGKDVQKLDNDPKVQLKIHTVGFWYWTINFPLVTYLFFFQKILWLNYGLFITLIYSIYANFSTDYAGMSSAQAVINTQGYPVEVKSEAFGSGVEVKKK